MTLRVLLVIVGSLLMADPGRAQDSGPVTPLTLEAALALAQRVNPVAGAAAARQRVDSAAIRQAAERPNPEGHLEFERETPNRTYGVQVPVELGGKRSRRLAVATATYREGEASVAQQLFALRTEVRVAFVEQVAAERRLDLLSQLTALATRIRDSASQRFSAGDISRLDLVQAELALTRARADATAAAGVLAAARIRLNTLLVVPAGARTRIAPPADVEPPPVAAVMPLALNASTALLVMDRAIDTQLARIAMARATQVPDLAPDITLTRGAEPDFATGWRAGLAVSLPLFTRHRSGVQLEEAELTRLSLARQVTTSRLAGDVAAAAAGATASWDALQGLRTDALPRAEETERMAEDAYALGQTGIAPVLQALQAAREIRLMEVEATRTFHLSLADLEQAAGTPLP